MRGRSLLLVLVLVVLMAACKVDTTVTVHVDGDGSGEVTARLALDADAVRAAEASGAKLRDAIRLSDLQAAGWKSSGWQRTQRGGAVLTVSKGFARAQDASKVVAELSGPDGPLHDVDVERDVSTFRTNWTFTGVADLENLHTGIKNDPALVQKLTAARVDVDALDQTLLLQTRDAFRLRVVSDLPDSSPKRFPVPPGSRVAMRDTSSQTAKGRVLLFGIGFVVAIVAVLIFLFGEARDQRKRRRYARTLPSSGKGVDLFEPRVEPGREPDE
jgi:hypothetical protein